MDSPRFPLEKQSMLASKERPVLFRRLVAEIPSTTYGTFGLYRYPAKFIPQVVAYALKNYARPGMSIFDPFAGYGTVGVVAKVYGHDYELWDLNPLLEVLHRVSTMKPPIETDVKGLIKDIDASKHEFVPRWHKLSYWFPEEILPFLFKVWGYYHSLEDEETKNLLVIPLLKTTNFFSYNDSQRQKLSRSPLAMEKVNRLLAKNWKDEFLRMLECSTCAVLKKLQEYWSLQPKIVNAVVKGGVDTLQCEMERKHDILMTSPPYLQAQEYIRSTKLDLFWLGFSEAQVKQLNRMELPYRDAEPLTVQSPLYSEWQKRVKEPHLRRLFDRYFWGVLGALTRLQSKIETYLFFFVGPANIRGENIPIHRIFLEHFTALGWTHEATLIDSIVARRMFSYGRNPATGVADRRMLNEHLVILRR